MAGTMTFSIEVYHKNIDRLPSIANKVRDLTEFFQSVYDSWVRGNDEKFQAGEGMESAGAAIDPNVFWQPLTPGYMKAKRRKGYEDALMVATGSLRDTMSNPDALFNFFGPERAMFGTPLDPDEMLKIQFNWNKRQVVFLSEPDQQKIRSLWQKYLQIPMQSVTREVAQMDADFQATVANG